MCKKIDVSKMKKDFEPSPADGAITTARVALGAVPYAGSVLAELVNAMFGWPVQRRRDDWTMRLAETLNAVIDKVEGITPESLMNNEVFITTAIHATQIAMKNHQKEKLEALRNAVFNAASTTSLNEDMQLMFLNWVDELTVSQIRILKFAENPKKCLDANKIQLVYSDYGTSHATPLSLQHIARCIGLGEREDVFSQFIDELFTKGLIPKNIINEINGGSFVIESFELYNQRLEYSYLTTIGRDFIDFITDSPIAK